MQESAFFKMKQAEFFLIPFVLSNDDPPVNPFDRNFPDTAFDILKDLIHVDAGIDGGLGNNVPLLSAANCHDLLRCEFLIRIKSEDRCEEAFDERVL